MSQQQSISIFGLGYVGAVTAACLAEHGHQIIGVDVRQGKVDLINAGRSPIVEKGIDDLISGQVRAGRLGATTDPQAAVEQSQQSIVCVGTPSGPGGEINTQFVETVCREIGEAIGKKASYHTVVIRSTVLPGITRGILIPILEHSSGKTAGRDFGVCFNPEFLREASAIEDFNKPSKTVVGEFDTASGEAVVALYRDLPGAIVRTAIETAEMTKYAANAWHALKVSFANEIGSLSKIAGVDSHEVMNIFCLDTKLNLSASYLKPGFAFGGSCLPKDVRAILSMARRHKVETPLLESILPSNNAHLDRALRLIRNTGARKVGFLGLAFKAGTDDMRESPAVLLLQSLKAEGIDVVFFDEGVSPSRLTGENHQFLLSRVPDFEALAVADATALAAMVDVLVVTQHAKAHRTIVGNRRKDQVVIDLVHLEGQVPRDGYCQLC